jgi:hypothetical protein
MNTMPVRWRLILGSFAEDSLPLDDSFGELEDALDFLYRREYGGGIRQDGSTPGRGGRDRTALTVPLWIAKIRRLFSRRTVEILQKEALEKYRLTEILTDPEVLKTMEPNVDLLKNILSFRDIIPREVKDLAYRIVDQAVRDIQKKLENRLRRSFTGKKLASSDSPYRVYRNFDIKRTIKKNLKNYNEDYKTIVAEKLYFNQNIRRYNPWNIIILVDESGSMLDSVIYSSIMAGIFSRLPFLAVNLAIFDTSLVDLSGSLDDPVGILMKIQLGGGTDIHGALEYGKKLISSPHKTIVVLVSDLCDGKDYRLMYGSARDIVESGAKLLVLTALDYESRGAYDKRAAACFASLGAHVAALTPEALADWIAGVIA